jgi:hydrogenase/urease accessory protein HupE
VTGGDGSHKLPKFRGDTSARSEIRPLLAPVVGLVTLLFVSGTAWAHAFDPTVVACRASDEKIECGATAVQGRTIAVERESIVHVTFSDGKVIVGTARPGVPLVVPAKAEPRVPWRFFAIGVTHILGGIDHVALVILLVMMVRRARPLLYTLSAFTVGHSVTLALAALGAIHVPQPPVEALIAITLVLLARELLAKRPSSPRRAIATALIFGLVHGLGFAGALGEVGLPEGAIAPALLAFNLGVEAGQLLMVAALLLVSLVRLPERWRLAPAWAVGALGCALALDRFAAFFEVLR